jgi:hypothetical protein
MSGRDNRERIDGARQGAEDLFKPKQYVAPAAGVTPTLNLNLPSPAEQQAPRRPRILPIQLTPPMSAGKVEPPHEPEPEGNSAIVEQRMTKILPSQFGRVRALTRYGMTPAQVAELYRVRIDEVERIICRPNSRGKL